MVNSIENAAEFSELTFDHPLNLLSLSKADAERKDTARGSVTSVEAPLQNFSRDFDGNDITCGGVNSFAQIINEFAENYTETEYSQDITKKIQSKVSQ